jgi:hypothetical protein
MLFDNADYMPSNLSKSADMSPQIFLSKYNIFIKNAECYADFKIVNMIEKYAHKKFNVEKS